MRFLLDANLPLRATDLLRSLGHQADDVRQVGLGTAPDAEIAAYARANALAIVTRDLDFGDVRNYPPAEYSGLVVLRLPDDYTAPEVIGAMRVFFSSARLIRDLPGRLAVVEPDKVRFRPKP